MRTDTKVYKIWYSLLCELNDTCKICGSEDKLYAEHLMSFENYPELRYRVDNGVLLCKSCRTKYRKHLKKYASRSTKNNFINYIRSSGMSGKELMEFIKSL